MYFNNLTTIQEYSYYNNEIYLYDICKNFNLDFNFLIIRYLITVIIIFLLFRIFTYLKDNYKNKIISFIYERFYFLNTNIGMVISFILLWHIVNIKYEISPLFITISKYIVIILLFIRYINKESLEAIKKWIKQQKNN